MIVQYNKITPEHRTLVRSIESKAYVGYIRYLLLKRWNFERVRKELMRLGLAWNEQEDFEIYFQEVLYPLITKNRLSKYFKRYRFGMNDETLTVRNTFANLESERIAFIDMLKTLEIEQFFLEEIVNFYGGSHNIPNHPTTGLPLVEREKPVDLVGLLHNPKRHVIETLLLEGYSPKQINEHLFQRYDMDVTAQEIKVYAKSFFNVKRQDIQRLIDSLQEEKEALEKRLLELKRLPPDDISFGERYDAIATASQKLTELSSMIKKLSGVHLGASYNAAVLETTDMREMFKDVMVRAHRRFRELDDRTEDEIGSRLNLIVNMMAKATDKIMDIDEILSQKTTKTINEEMLEVITPTLDRIEQEEREAMYAYKQVLNKSDDEEDDDNDIIGLD